MGVLLEVDWDTLISKQLNQRPFPIDQLISLQEVVLLTLGREFQVDYAEESIHSTF